MKTKPTKTLQYKIILAGVILIILSVVFLLNKYRTEVISSLDQEITPSPTIGIPRYSSKDTYGSSKIGAYFGQDEFSFTVSEDEFNSKINSKKIDSFRLQALNVYPEIALEKMKYPRNEDIIKYLKENVKTDIIDNYYISRYSTSPNKIFEKSKIDISNINWFQVSASLRGIPIIMTHTAPDIAQWANILLKDDKWDLVIHLSLSNKITETIEVNLRNFHKTKYHIENKNILMLWSDDIDQMPQNQFIPNTETPGQILIDDIKLVYVPQTNALIPMYLICGTQTPNPIVKNKKIAYVCGVMEAVDYRDDGLTDIYKY